MSTEDNNRNARPEDAGRLAGGYATGNLSESEQEALFQAALEDQEVFNQLMEEQALKELIEEPAVKAQILEAIEEQPSIWARLLGWVRTPVAWCAAASVTAALVVTVSVRKTGDSTPVSEMARVMEKQSPVETALGSEPGVAGRPAADKNRIAKREVVPVTVPPVAAGPRSGVEKDEPVNVVTADRLNRQEPVENERLETATAAVPPPPPRMVAATGVAPGESAMAKTAEVAASPRQASEESVAIPLWVEYQLERSAGGGAFQPLLSSQSPAQSDLLRLQLKVSVPGQLSLFRRTASGQLTPVTSVDASAGQMIMLPGTGGFSSGDATSLVLRFARLGALGMVGEYRSADAKKEAFSLSMQDRENRLRATVSKTAPRSWGGRADAPAPNAQSLVVEIPLRNR
jgi:hypothetical protein